MAGAGYKLFNTGDVLTAAQVNTYLQEQAVMRFASAAARTTALSGVLAEGMVSYLMDTNAVEVYDGSAWVGMATGDITAVTAGTGISGGGTSGAVTITNSMATEITAAGDIIVGTGSGTFDNLPIGTTGQVLTADTTVSPYKVKWAAAGGASALTFISTQTASDVATLTFDNVFSTTYTNYFLIYNGVRSTSGATTADLYFQLRYAGPTTQAATYTYALSGATSGSAAINVGGASQSQVILLRNLGNSSYRAGGQMFIQDIGIGTITPTATGQSADMWGEEVLNYYWQQGTNRTYTGFIISTSSGNINGTFTLYGLAKS